MLAKTDQRIYNVDRHIGMVKSGFSFNIFQRLLEEKYQMLD